MKYTFAAKESGPLSAAQAQVVGPELLRIEAVHQCIKPEIVVDEARSETSPLHSFFTWDDAEAAEHCRQDEARRIIRSVIIIPDPEEDAPTIRAFVSVKSVKNEDRFSGQAYVSTVTALSDERYRAQVIEAAHAELVAWKNRYKALKEFAKVFEAVEELAARL